VITLSSDVQTVWPSFEQLHTWLKLGRFKGILSFGMADMVVEASPRSEFCSVYVVFFFCLFLCSAALGGGAVWLSQTPPRPSWAHLPPLHHLRPSQSAAGCREGSRGTHRTEAAHLRFYLLGGKKDPAHSP